MRQAISLLVLVGIVGGTAVAWFGMDRARVERELQDALARAVDVLPPGTEDAWISYADQQFARAIQRHGDTLKVVDSLSKILHRTTFISLNYPYSISCHPVLGIKVEFHGSREHTIDVPIYRTMASKLNEEARPPLSVDKRSVAAVKLSALLCERVSDRMQEVMKTSR